MLRLKPAAKIVTSRGTLVAKPIILGYQKPIYVVVDSTDPGQADLVGEILSVYGRFDQNQAVEGFTTLDSFMRQTMKIAQENAIRSELLDAKFSIITNIASSLLVNWRSMPAGTITGIKSTLNDMALSLANARNPELIKASKRVKAAKDLQDSTGRDNPLIAETRLKAAIRNFGIEKAQGELVEMSVQARRTNALELGQLVKQSIGKLFALLDQDSTSTLDVVNMLDRLAIKPYYFAVDFAKKLIDEYGIGTTTADQIKRAFTYEATMISLGDVLSILRDNPQRYSRMSISLRSFRFSQPIEDARYIDHRNELERGLLNLETATRMLTDTNGPERDELTKQITKQIGSIKDMIRYRDWQVA